MMKYWIGFICVLMLNTGLLIGQSFERMDVPVYKDGVLLPLFNAGGLRNPQFSNIDFDGDGIQDLFVFDKNGDVILPFIKTGQKGSLDYKFAPEYIDRFPKLQAWTLLVDYNHDGIQDIFTSSASLPNCCVEVWQGNRDNIGKLYYTKVLFDGLPFRDILQFQIGGSYTNIYVSSVDLPAIVDVDGDGDIDIVSFEPDGSYASFYKNVAVEEGLGKDVLKFVRQDICWGKFAENQYNEKLTLSDNAFGCANPFWDGGNTGLRHSGSTLTIFDTNGDGLMDLILGDIDSPKLAKLVNGGTKENAWMKQLELNFPVDDESVNLGYFVSVFYVDADGDNIRDLIVAPNDVSIGENRNHIWFYRNVGTDKSPIFKLVKKDFLVDEMAYFYGGSHPAFADVNGDGLIDIVVGISSIIDKNHKYENRLILLLNTGTTTNPVFYVADEDYLGFAQIGSFVGRLAPYFEDITGDGMPDLFVGDAFGQVYFFKNLATSGQPFNFDKPVYPYFDIFVGQNAKPLVMDIDGDGLKDIVMGKKNNELNFFKNQGSPSNPLFTDNPGSLPNLRQLGNLFSGNDFFTQNGAPAIIHTKENETLLILGTEAASIRSYNLGRWDGTYELKSTKFGGVFEGRKVVPAFYDLNNDGFLEMVVGNERGGLAFYKTDIQGSTSSAVTLINESTIDIFPNPASSQLYVNCTDRNAQIYLLDMQSRVLKTLTNGAYNTIDSHLPDGMYFISVATANGFFTQKVIIQR